MYYNLFADEHIAVVSLKIIEPDKKYRAIIMKEYTCFIVSYICRLALVAYV